MPCMMIRPGMFCCRPEELQHALGRYTLLMIASHAVHSLKQGQRMTGHPHSNQHEVRLCKQLKCTMLTDCAVNVPH